MDRVIIGGSSELNLPGFRFHPTEEELLNFYLRRAAHGKKLNFDAIGTLNIYHYDPWELPGLAKMGEREWYFYVVRDRKSGHGGRPNRTTERGFWKATGSDRPVRSAADPKRLIGLKKTLVFYIGRAPRGTRTDWVMNEYRQPDGRSSGGDVSHKQEETVLCKVYRKATSLKELEQRAAMEDYAKASLSTTFDNMSASDDQKLYPSPKIAAAASGEDDGGQARKMAARMAEETIREVEVTSTLAPPPGVNVQELQSPEFSSEWTQDPFWTQLRSPWLDSFYANIF